MSLFHCELCVFLCGLSGKININHKEHKEDTKHTITYTLIFRTIFLLNIIT
jgi:hypothetical protein